MRHIKNFTIEIDGVDKCGKDTVKKYLDTACNYSNAIYPRGIISQLVYNDKFDRYDGYEILHKPILILLTVNKEDGLMRYKLTHEPLIDFMKDQSIFEAYADELEKQGFTVYRYNTTENTPYFIAQDINNKLKKLEVGNFILEKPIVIENKHLYKKEI